MSSFISLLNIDSIKFHTQLICIIGHNSDIIILIIIIQSFCLMTLHQLMSFLSTDPTASSKSISCTFLKNSDYLSACTFHSSFDITWIGVSSCSNPYHVNQWHPSNWYVCLYHWPFLECLTRFIHHQLIEKASSLVRFVNFVLWW